MSRAALKGAGVSAFLGMMAVAAPAFAGFGAVAYDQSSGKYGLSWNENTQRLADEAALRGCTGEHCKIVFRVPAHRCGALATSEDGKIWGGAVRSTADAAKLAALENCQKRGTGQCVIRGSGCNR